MRRRSITLPAATKPATPPQSWAKALHLPFNTTWMRTGGATDPVCVDCKTWTPRTTSALWYADAAAFNRFGSTAIVGTSCPSHATYFAGGQYAGSTNGLYTFGYSQGSGDLCLSWIGLDQLALPLFGSYRNAPCYLYTTPLVLHPTRIRTSSSTGYASRWTWLNPVKSAHVGETFMTQMAAVDRLGAFKLTHGRRVRIGRGINGKERQGTVYNMAIGTQTFDPDRDPAKYLSNQVLIYGVY